MLAHKVIGPDDQESRSKMYSIAWKCSLGVQQQCDGLEDCSTWATESSLCTILYVMLSQLTKEDLS